MRHLPVVVALAVGLAAGAGWALRADASEAPARVQWEYKTVTFRADYPSLEGALATAGAEGYELVLISPQETVAIFKRPSGG